jgi:hypothetical protein
MQRVCYFVVIYGGKEYISDYFYRYIRGKNEHFFQARIKTTSGLRSSGTLRGVGWYLVAGVLGQALHIAYYTTNFPETSVINHQPTPRNIAEE